MSKSFKKRSFSKSTKIRPVVMPLEPLKGSHQLTPQERMFLDAAERGDRHAMIRCLQGPNPVNINCTNMLGRTGIQIAVDNENVEIVELLLKQDGVKIGDALLYAIREGVYRIVEMLIDHPSISVEMLGQDWSKIRKTGEESSDYSPDISPVILAAHCNQFEILQLLITRGAYIDRPHQLSCPCKKCQDQVHEDSLRHSLLRINTYRALASPAWISLTSPDPILTAFRLSWELQKLALRENEFKDTYIELSEQCKRYACDLLNQCRSSEEVIAVLNKECYSDSEDDEEESHAFVSGEKLTLSRLKLALKYEQKQFVAHPHCQQLLTSIWYEGLPGWRKRNGPTKFLICMGLIFILPFMSVYYLIFPRSKIGQLLRSPFMKFLYHSASFGAFLFFLLLDAFGVASSDSPNMENLRSPPPTELEWLIFFWVLGFVWSECKQLWDEGLKAYIRQWWNWLDFIMLSLYLATFSLRFVGYIQIESGKYGPRQMPRDSWPIYDPTLVAEGLFSVANVFSFARIIYLFQANQHLGPLQISLGCMLIDIAKFLFIFFLVLTSFACGFNQLYWYYKDTKLELEDSYLTLYWSLFGLTAVKDINIRNGQQFTKVTSMLLFMIYHAMSIIVLINMLIAMMSNSFQNIENHADMEWKFARSKLWMGYFDEGSTLPPPFNLLISPKSVYYFFNACRSLLSSCCSSSHRKQHRHSHSRKRYNLIYMIKPDLHGFTIILFLLKIMRCFDIDLCVTITEKISIKHMNIFQFITSGNSEMIGFFHYQMAPNVQTDHDYLPTKSMHLDDISVYTLFISYSSTQTSGKTFNSSTYEVKILFLQFLLLFLKIFKYYYKYVVCFNNNKKILKMIFLYTMFIQHTCEQYIQLHFNLEIFLSLFKKNQVGQNGKSLFLMYKRKSSNLPISAIF
ncbi:hypothetical protein KUTeg_024411 [Tegillarca granosa]|uniref:Transient receptor ion channel domain-containing protein n=1 Tax=Tegillarca granosa TaxID=220873 RepID=A0ABQ9E307_TEGGR|nr:hypothetical protein KUTeg_024411 [Tegillarca granosa]